MAARVEKEIDQTAYFQRLTPMDARLRGCAPPSSPTCRTHLLAYSRSLTAREAERLQASLRAVDAVSWSTLRTLPWNIRVFDPNHIEHGFPHTHGDTLFLPAPIDPFLKPEGLRTLLHEKIHVFQRFYPFETHDLVVKMWGFAPATLETALPPDARARRRTNPDTNEIVYATPQGLLMGSVYAPDATHIGHVQDLVPSGNIPSPQTDHPYEVMACILTDLLMPEHSQHNPNDFYKQAHAWVQKWT